MCSRLVCGWGRPWARWPRSRRHEHQRAWRPIQLPEQRHGRFVRRFDARRVGSGVWGIWDGGVMSWRATDLAEDDARQQAADLNVTFNQYGQRDQADRREVSPPIEVESAT